MEKAASVPEFKLKDGALGSTKRERMEIAIWVFPDMVGPTKNKEVNNRSMAWISDRKVHIIA